MHQERGQEISSEPTGPTVSSSLPHSTPTKESHSDPNSSLTSSPSSPRSQGSRSYPQKPPVHPRRVSQTLSIKSTSSPPRDSTVPTTPPSPGMISPITSAAVKGTEASLSRGISTTYKPYLSRTSTSSLRASAGMQTASFGGALTPDVISPVDPPLPSPSAPRFSPAHLHQPAATQPMPSSSKLSTIKGYIAEKGGSHRHMRGSPAVGTAGYGLYSAYSTSASASTPTSSTPPSGSASSATPFSTPQSQPQPQSQHNLTPSYPAYIPRQSWRSWATDKIGSASAKVQAGAAIVASSASSWKENRDSQRGPGDDYAYYNHHHQHELNADGQANPSSRRYQKRGGNSSVSSPATGDEKLLLAGASGLGSSRGNAQTNASGCATVLAPGGVLETLHIFPGWGVRRYRADVVAGNAPRPFDIELYISGFAIYSKTPETASRSQRAFVRLAKGFASLPKLPVLPNILPDIANAAANMMSPSAKTPPAVPPKPKGKATLESSDQLIDLDSTALSSERPKEGHRMDEAPDSEWNRAVDAAAEAQLKDDFHEIMFHPNGSSSDAPRGSSQPQPDEEVHSSEQLQHALLTKLHENLERRLLPFWSSVLANRTVKIAVWLGHRGDSQVRGHSHSRSHSDRFKNIESNEAEEAELMNPPLVEVTVQTAADGSFSARVWVSWEELCVHPKGVHMVFGEEGHQTGEGTEGGPKKLHEHEVEVWVEMPLMGSEMVTNPEEPTSPGGIRRPGTVPHSHSAPSLPLSPPTASSSISSSSIPTVRNNTPTLRTQVAIPITHTPIRVLSDIDDTIKSAGVLSGARAIFHNVFVKDLRDIVIPGMGEWYAGMWSLGVRFHYVSNGPFEMLPVVNEFFQMAQLPPGSIKLRSYAGRSLFNGLLSAPAARKRQGVIDVLESFKDSRFILVGDSGEQDLELYAQMARERPHQILAVFVRDVMADTYRPGEAPMPIDDPTGWGVYGIGREGVPAALGLEAAIGGTTLAGLGLSGEEGSTAVGQKDGDIMDQDIEVPPRYITSSPTMELGGEMFGAPADLDATPKPNDFSTRFEDSSSVKPDGPARLVTAPPASKGSDSPGFKISSRRRISCEENASTAALLDGISVPKPEYNPRPSTSARLKGVLASSRPGSRSSARKGSGVIDTPPTPTAPPMVPTLVRSSSGLGAAIALPTGTDGQTDYFTSNKKLEADYDSDGSAPSSLSSESESTSTSSAEWGQSQWRGGKRRRMKRKLGLTRSSGSRSSGGGSGASGGWRGVSRRSTGSESYNGAGGPGSTGSMSETEKKRVELQSRVYRARTIMPSSVALRVFRDPAECVEAEEILRREGMA